MTRTRRPDAGFTLVELLIALSILGVIMVPLTGALFSGFRMIDQTSNSLTSSSDAQFLSIYLPPDIKSAASGLTSGFTCTGTTTPKLRLTMSTATGGGALASAADVVYWVKTVVISGRPSTYQLVRSVCTGGTASTEVVVARNLASASSATASAITGGFKVSVTAKKARTEAASYVYVVSGRFRTGIPS